MAVVAPPADAPEQFRRAVSQLRQAPVRPEVTLSEAPAPQRLAPHALALSAEVVVGDDELASGRLVLLHDPAGQEAWEGCSRFVAYLRAPIDPEMADDPLLPSVGWSWLVEALDSTGAAHRAPAGTVSRVACERFGALAAQPHSAEMELRASWTPADERFAAHLTAFSELLCSAAGLPPAAPGVVAMHPPNRVAGRGRRRR